MEVQPDKHEVRTIELLKSQLEQSWEFTRCPELRSELLSRELSTLLEFSGKSGR